MDTPLEIEIKIPVDDLESIRRVLRVVSAELVHQMTREENLLFETRQGYLCSKGLTLRLRRYGEHQLLTLKGPVNYNGAVKEREELEVMIEDLDRMTLIFAALGFNPSARYEKDREVWDLNGVTVVLDHTPMGDFVEVEGPEDKILIVARKIGLDPERAIRGSYIGLWQEFRLSNPDRGLPVDMVFEK